ncbi:MAG: hypothetical protein M1830_005805 [Pleopsidium flavum]|nr:MAG: hypothetical protein M1830_005805 [Pleopsidium flavum]
MAQFRMQVLDPEHIDDEDFDGRYLGGRGVAAGSQVRAELTDDEKEDSGEAMSMKDFLAEEIDITTGFGRTIVMDMMQRRAMCDGAIFFSSTPSLDNGFTVSMLDS